MKSFDLRVTEIPAFIRRMGGVTVIIPSTRHIGWPIILWIHEIDKSNICGYFIKHKKMLLVIGTINWYWRHFLYIESFDHNTIKNVQKTSHCHKFSQKANSYVTITTCSLFGFPILRNNSMQVNKERSFDWKKWQPLESLFPNRQHFKYSKFGREFCDAIVGIGLKIFTVSLWVMSNVGLSSRCSRFLIIKGTTLHTNSVWQCNLWPFTLPSLEQSKLNH